MFLNNQKQPDATIRPIMNLFYDTWMDAEKL